MTGFIIIAVIATLTGCQCVMTEDTLKFQPKKCCFKDTQMSMDMIDLKTINSEGINMLITQIDGTTYKQVMLNNTLYPKYGKIKEQNKILIDYGKSLMYYIPADMPGACYKMPYTVTFDACIPDDAEYLGSSFLGVAGKGMLPYDGWRYTSRTGGLVVTMAMSKDCVPMMEGTVDPKWGENMFMINNYQPKLTDPSAFDLPDTCK